MTACGQGSGRVMLLVAHTGRAEALRVSRLLAAQLTAAGIGLRVLEPEAGDLAVPAAAVVPVSAAAASGTEMVLVVGGDGTLLRAAELARPAGVPLLGVNLGHVGFLAEAEPEDLGAAVASVVARRYSIERRMTVEVCVRANGHRIADAWALNEATVEKAARERMLDLVIEVDGRPLSRWGCDGVVFATPTGSTAYAFSAGGPVVWPEVEAMLMVPISAHALFARPMAVSPESVMAAEVIGAVSGQPARHDQPALPGRRSASERLPAEPTHQAAGGLSETAGAVLWCDGRRMVELSPGARVEVRRGSLPVLLARLPAVAGAQPGGPAARVGAPFTDRLVEKFGLPVAGWRGQPEERAALAELMGEDAVARDAVAERPDEESPGHA